MVLWGKIFGVPGLMLAIPINLTIASLIEHLYIRRRDPGELKSPILNKIDAPDSRTLSS